VEGVSKTKVGRGFNPNKYGMIFCPNCSGSGRSFADAQGVNVCNVCGGFGLIKKEEKKASLIESHLFGCLGEFVSEKV
jgi:rRNA maturation endonuclease Nob1